MDEYCKCILSSVLLAMQCLPWEQSLILQYWGMQCPITEKMKVPKVKLCSVNC